MNYNPRLTPELVGRGVFADEPLVVVDGGARAGAHSMWSALGSAAEILGFDPDAEEVARLNSEQHGDGARHRYYAAALGARRETRDFFHPEGSFEGSFYPGAPVYSRVSMGSPTTAPTTPVPTVSDPIELVDLDSFSADNGIDRIDFMKLDVEGGELDVLNGARRIIEESPTLGIELEVHFPERPGVGTFADLDIFLRSVGFVLYDLDLYRRARNALPMPTLYDYRNGDGNPVTGPTIAGQVMIGDAVYFRDLVEHRIPGHTFGPQDAIRVLKLASLYELYGLSDCAAELLLEYRGELAPTARVLPLLDFLTPEVDGKYPTYDEYLRYAERFFDRENRVFGPNWELLTHLWQAAQLPEPSNEAIVAFRKEVARLRAQAAGGAAFVPPPADSPPVRAASRTRAVARRARHMISVARAAATRTGRR